MTPKELVKLAAACRKAGITHYRCGDVEFTIGEAPAASATKSTVNVQGDVQSDELSDDALLHWSVMDIPESDTPSQ